MRNPNKIIYKLKAMLLVIERTKETHNESIKHSIPHSLRDCSQTINRLVLNDSFNQ